MPKLFTRADYEAAAAVIRARTKHQPTIGIVLGSGLAPVADVVENADFIPYEDIPNWPHSAVIGHKNRLVIGQLEGQTVLVQQGRAHYYEGYSQQEVAFPIRVMQVLGIQLLIVSNASGGLNKAFNAGDLMLMTDHINMMGFAGVNPLVGPNDESLGVRFPDMTIAYDLDLRRLAHEIAVREGFTLQEGVYAYIAGPTFESPAEVRLLTLLGADAVGMSTVPEVVVARHAGMRVMGLSGVANGTNESSQPGMEITHVDVLENINKHCAPKMIKIVRGVLRSL